MASLRLSVALLLFTCLGRASTIIVTGLDAPLGMQQTLWINEQGTNQSLYWVGGIDARIDGTYNRVMWCVQLFVDINPNVTYNSVIDFADTPGLKRVGWLIQNIFPTLTTQTQGAALQLAIWDIIEDGGDGFDVGKGQIYKSTDAAHLTDAGVLSAAQSYEAQSLGKIYPWVPVYHNTTLGGTPVQNLVGPITPDGGPLSQSPEPRDAVLVLGGLALIGLGRWRKNRLAALAENR